MPPVEEMLRYLDGTWRMMTGRREGIRMLDISADGFWNSFFAIVLAMPPMLLGWVPSAAELAGVDAGFGERLFLVLRLALVDIGSWVLPIAALAAVAPTLGIADRFTHYVVSANWGSVILIWFMVPASLLRLLAPEMEQVSTALALGIFVATLVLTWRLTDAAIDRGAGMTTGIFGAVLFASILTLFALQDLLGVAPVSSQP